ncbi:hypothetical protein ACIXOH_14390, partial [Bacteroides fragilis]
CKASKQKDKKFFSGKRYSLLILNNAHLCIMSGIKVGYSSHGTWKKVINRLLYNFKPSDSSFFFIISPVRVVVLVREADYVK